jgi:hypothetical protein
MPTLGNGNRQWGRGFCGFEGVVGVDMVVLADFWRVEVEIYFLVDAGDGGFKVEVRDLWLKRDERLR